MAWLVKNLPAMQETGVQEEKGMIDDEIVEQHNQLNGHEFEQTLGDSKEQRSLAYFSPGIIKSWTQLSDYTTTRPRETN